MPNLLQIMLCGVASLDIWWQDFFKASFLENKGILLCMIPKSFDISDFTLHECKGLFMLLPLSIPYKLFHARGNYSEILKHWALSWTQKPVSCSGFCGLDDCPTENKLTFHLQQIPLQVMGRCYRLRSVPSLDMMHFSFLKMEATRLKKEIYCPRYFAWWQKCWTWKLEW